MNNPRYFVDPSGRATYLTGVHLKNDLVDRSDKAVLDFASYLDLLEKSNHNFIRLWAWQQATLTDENNAKIIFDPLPYRRTGPGTALDGDRKFDLTRFNQAYFDRLRSRVAEAGQRGIYVSVMLFQGFGGQQTINGANLWAGHPFNRRNNINGINGDPSGTDNGAAIYSLTVPSVRSLQEAYVRKVVDTLNDLDNVLYEIIGDAPATSKPWQDYMINYLKNYEAGKPKQHPVGISYSSLGTPDDLSTSPADWVLIAGASVVPPLATGDKVVFLDMDPGLLSASTSYQLVWNSFMRGLNPIYLESDLAAPRADQTVRDTMGDALNYSQLVDLSAMSPSATLCSTGFCLCNPGVEYLVYLPSGGTVELDLSSASGTFVANWFSPSTAQTLPGGSVVAGSPVTLTSPINGDAVLYLRAAPALADQNSVTSPTAGGQKTSAPLQTGVITSMATVDSPTISPSAGAFVTSVTVTLQTATEEALIHYTTDGTQPTLSSKQYTAPFLVTTTTLVKAQAFKAGMSPSSPVSAWFTKDALNAGVLAPKANNNDTVWGVITLTWTDNSDDENGFDIERMIGVDGTFSRIATVPANTTSYADASVISGNTYCYRVNASNAAGSSPYTNQACMAYTATAIPPPPAPQEPSPPSASLPPPESQPPSTSLPTGGLVAHYQFNETSGATAADSSGNGNNAALANGAGWTPSGKLAGALSFDGVEGYASFVSSAQSSISISAWVYPQVTAGNLFPRIIDTPGYVVLLAEPGPYGSNSMSLGFLSRRSIQDGEWDAPIDSMAYDTWIHVVAVYDSSSTSSNPALYINGVKQPLSQISAPQGSQTPNDGAGIIGNRIPLNRGWNGSIDDLRIYNRVLSDSEIQAIYQQSF